LRQFRDLLAYPGIQEVWTIRRRHVSDEFREFVEREIIGKESHPLYAIDEGAHERKRDHQPKSIRCDHVDCCQPMGKLRMDRSAGCDKILTMMIKNATTAANAVRAQ
jgi:hypothetical protein